MKKEKGEKFKEKFEGKEISFVVESVTELEGGGVVVIAVGSEK